VVTSKLEYTKKAIKIPYSLEKATNKIHHTKESRISDGYSGYDIKTWRLDPE